FIGLLIYFAKVKKLPEAFKAKREAIRADLIRAEEEKQSALSRLTSAEAKLAALDAEKARVLETSRSEAVAEKSRIDKEADAEVKKLQDQTTGEITRLSNQAKTELRRFSAEESIRRAEEKLRSQIDAAKDARLVKTGIEAIGGLR
ncbi:MAG: hypothetical protein LC730_03260, partial [Acidobacteria bacterium]|nr:hypothetical protein [Acidobacteriota bacterium]MCA1608462.1 hypothetical protein [Acidobacteriota bacterium]